MFSEDLDQRIQEKLLVQSDLRSALANGELDLVYQPQLELATGAPVSAEALLRWHHPTRGDVPRELFVPILEESGLLDEVGRWTLERALDDLSAWRARGARLARVAVNLESRQLLDGRLVGFVRDLLASRGLDGSSLELELTEHGLVGDFAASNRTFGELRKMGVRIAVDDFGTGYSSLGYLNELEFDVLKIDRKFVAGIYEGKVLAIIEAVAKVAHTLDKSIVAEGIESARQHSLLAELGCDMGQGFLFCRPLRAEEVAEWILARGGAAATGTAGRAAGS